MIAPQAPARLALLGAAASALTALLIGWARAEEGVPDDSPEWPRHERLELGLRFSLARLRFKEALFADLEGGRLALPEAAARLADFHAREPRVGGMVTGSDAVRGYPGRTDQERCAWYLAQAARTHASIRPSEANERAALRLEGELAQVFGH